MPFAITTSVTLGGVVSEHGGAPIRMIRLSGTTGVLFGRSAAAAPVTSFGPNIFGGTLAAAGATAAAAQAIGSTQSAIANVVPDSDFNPGGDLENLTGYYQMRLMSLFLEAYVQLKKTKEGRTARLAFATWKDEAVWLCEPTGEFRVSKSSRNAFRYDYDLSLKAYKRIQIGAGTSGEIANYVPVQKDPSKLAAMLRTVSQVRAVVQNASATIAAVGGDVHYGLYEPMRELGLFAKDALSVPLAVADMPDSIIQAMRPAILDLMSAPGAARRIFANGDSSVADAISEVCPPRQRPLSGSVGQLQPVQRHQHRRPPAPAQGGSRHRQRAHQGSQDDWRRLPSPSRCNRCYLDPVLERDRPR
jgi:hypothetical protein